MSKKKNVQQHPSQQQYMHILHESGSGWEVCKSNNNNRIHTEYTLHTWSLLFYIFPKLIWLTYCFSCAVYAMPDDYLHWDTWAFQSERTNWLEKKEIAGHTAVISVPSAQRLHTLKFLPRFSPWGLTLPCDWITVEFALNSNILSLDEKKQTKWYLDVVIPVMNDTSCRSS